ncbi:hypothetical protein AMTRI_Chr05g63950 [Amborella trichopoda]
MLSAQVLPEEAMTSNILKFSDEEMMVDEGLGYPRAYGKLCKYPHLVNPYSQGPPSTYIPYILHPQDVLRARELNQMFPVVETEGKAAVNAKRYADLLWKRLDHLGNAGFDPTKFRVDPYGNVLFYHADPASPLAWEIDHWFPISRGGKTVTSNLRLLQWQVCQKKNNKLEFLMPWWDLQLGISVDQFLSVFASRNSDFRQRAFYLLFSDGENEQYDVSEIIQCHSFPQHFKEKKRQVGLAPAAIVHSGRDPNFSVLKSLDVNRTPRPNTSAIALSSPARNGLVEEDETLCKAIQRFGPHALKENDLPDNNRERHMTMFTDIQKQKEDVAKKQAEILKLDEELIELKEKNDAERTALQDLECVLIRRRRRVEKCRRLAEAQSSYRAVLEKMIRDAMHQSIVYKEQSRLNQAAANALRARLEAQKAICDSSEKELHRLFKQREEIENQIKPDMEKARKRSRKDDPSINESPHKPILSLPEAPRRKTLQKQLRIFLAEEQKASQEGLPQGFKPEQLDEYDNKSAMEISNKKANLEISEIEEEEELENKLKSLAIKENCKSRSMKENNQKSRWVSEEEEAEERKRTGRGHIERWLQILLENTEEGSLSDATEAPQKSNEAEESHKDTKKPENELASDQNHNLAPLSVGESSSAREKIKETDESLLIGLKLICNDLEQQVEDKEGKGDGMKREKDGSEGKNLEKGGRELIVNGRTSLERDSGASVECRKSLERCGGGEIVESMKNSERGGGEAVGKYNKGFGSSSRSFGGREKGAGDRNGLGRSESARIFGHIPPSPSAIWGMRKGVDCIGKKPTVVGSDDDDNAVITGTTIKASIKQCTQAIKKAVKK